FGRSINECGITTPVLQAPQRPFGTVARGTPSTRETSAAGVIGEAGNMVVARTTMVSFTGPVQLARRRELILADCWLIMDGYPCWGSPLPRNPLPRKRSPP